MGHIMHIMSIKDQNEVDPLWEKTFFSFSHKQSHTVHKSKPSLSCDEQEFLAKADCTMTDNVGISKSKTAIKTNLSQQHGGVSTRMDAVGAGNTF